MPTQADLSSFGSMSSFTEVALVDSWLCAGETRTIDALDPSDAHKSALKLTVCSQCEQLADSDTV